MIQHHGHGPDPKRQEGPHPHQIELSGDNRFAIVPDLGWTSCCSTVSIRQKERSLPPIRRSRKSPPAPDPGISYSVPATNFFM